VGYRHSILPACVGFAFSAWLHAEFRLRRKRLRGHNEVSADDVVTALEGAYGVHPGERRNHTKGTCALGTFVGMPDVAAYSRSPLFSGRPVPVVARFSLAGGNPHARDAEKSPRGMALEFRLPMAACNT